MTGRKRVLLISPEYVDRVYMFEQDGVHDRQSRINSVHSPDLERFPLFDDVPALQGVIQAGDLLYIPYGWLHQVRMYWFFPSLCLHCFDYCGRRLNRMMARYQSATGGTLMSRLFVLQLSVASSWKSKAYHLQPFKVFALQCWTAFLQLFEICSFGGFVSVLPFYLWRSCWDSECNEHSLLAWHLLGSTLLNRTCLDRTKLSSAGDRMPFRPWDSRFSSS